MHCLPDICYKSKICDLTNEIDILSSFAGQASGQCENQEMKEDLLKVLNLTYKLMGKLRDNCDFLTEDKMIMEDIEKKYDKKGREIRKHIFVLPQGSFLSSTLHICRAFSKKISRMYYKAKSEITFDTCEIEEAINMMSDIFYNMALCANHREGKDEIPVVLNPNKK
ncbi:cobalamin adenosyltransferase [uncultured Ilyobacter sp.]|uniref:cobalamin adenosyltransferase n=1 Tax=uncultured Ilyobacter sp. TaxID=544433 RepID=UPI0029C8036A|nr:cobalamin adenosyltransferase [uncultured Ilyobacter sp.]